MQPLWPAALKREPGGCVFVQQHHTSIGREVVSSTLGCVKVTVGRKVAEMVSAFATTTVAWSPELLLLRMPLEGLRLSGGGSLRS